MIEYNIWNDSYKKAKHIYRDMANRTGHSNDNPSYWAYGYMTIDDMRTDDPELYLKYIQIHTRCCGFGLIRKK